MGASARLNRAALDALAESRAWARGDLGHTLSRRQRRMVAKWRNRRPSRFVLNWSRRGGKTRALVTLAIEECMRRKCAVTYAAPTQNDARDIAENEVTALLEGPGGQRTPYRYNVQRLRWTFPNGSYIQLAGCDGSNRNRLRGRTRDLIIIDEESIRQWRNVRRSIEAAAKRHGHDIEVYASAPDCQPWTVHVAEVSETEQCA